MGEYKTLKGSNYTYISKSVIPLLPDNYELNKGELAQLFEVTKKQLGEVIAWRGISDVLDCQEIPYTQRIFTEECRVICLNAMDSYLMGHRYYKRDIAETVHGKTGRPADDAAAKQVAHAINAKLLLRKKEKSGCVYYEPTTSLLYYYQEQVGGVDTNADSLMEITKKLLDEVIEWRKLAAILDHQKTHYTQKIFTEECRVVCLNAVNCHAGGTHYYKRDIAESIIGKSGRAADDAAAKLVAHLIDAKVLFPRKEKGHYVYYVPAPSLLYYYQQYS